MAEALKLGNAPIVFEKDIEDHEEYTACVEGCSGGEDGFIQCAHCCYWFHLQCFGLEEGPKKGKWYCGDECKKGGYVICIPVGEPCEDWDQDQLKAYCKHFSIPSSGNKDVLVARLKERLESGLAQWGEEKMAPSSVRFVARQGPTVFPNVDEDESLPWLELLWDESVWTMLVEATNIYAKSENGGWQDGRETTVEELKAYIGVKLRMAILGVSQVRDLWDSEMLEEKLVPENFSDIFSRERFEDLTRNLHVVDNGTKPDGPGRDRFWKLRPLVDYLQKIFKEHWDPHERLSLDEEGIKTKARIEMKQYNKEKPAKWFIKVFALVDSAKYLYAFNLYAGKVAEEDERRETSRSTRNSIGAADTLAGIPDVSSIYLHVVRLARQLPENRPFHLYLNNWYTNLRVMQDLRKRNVFVTGTLKPLSGGFPDAIKKGKVDEKFSWIWRTLIGKEHQFGCLKWKDTKDVMLASSYWPPHEASTVSQLRRKNFLSHFLPPQVLRRKAESPKDKEDVPAPIMVEDYNTHMGYVDGHGQRVRAYMTHRQSKSWWRCVFFWLFDCACFNAYLIYSHQPFNRRHHRPEYRTWLLRLADELIGGKSFRSRQKKRKLPPAEEAPEMDFGHAQVSQEGRQRCSSGCGRKTSLKCWKCEIWICKECWFESTSHPTK